MTSREGIVMCHEDNITRRKFIGNSVLGAGALGLNRTKSFESPNELKVDNAGMYGSPREAVVLSATMQNIKPGDNKIEKLIGRLNVAASYRPDIVCLPENFVNEADSAEPVPGPITDQFSSFALKNRCYVICTLIRKNGDRKFNTAVLIDRKGDIAGMYDKIHPAMGEIDAGTVPGPPDPPAFQTDFGKVGIQICFDINWVDDWRILKEKGVEIVFWPSVYIGGRMLSSYARLFNYYVVGCSRVGPSIIYDTAGDVITESGRFEKWAMVSLNLEKIHCEIDFHVKKVQAIRKKYGRKVAVQFYHHEDWVTIESRSPDLTVKQLIEEFDLESRWDYIIRSECYQSEHRK